jgi:ubiquinone/menaquinone biosynthesis C-methylase UbiE
MLDQLLNRAKENGARNILPVLSTAEDARLPAGKIDRILMVDVYHELEQPRAMLESIKRALAPGGKVILVEYRAEQDPATLPVRIPRDHKMSVVEVLREWLPAGFELAEYHEFLPAQHLFVFQKAAVQ